LPATLFVCGFLKRFIVWGLLGGVSSVGAKDKVQRQDTAQKGVIHQDQLDYVVHYAIHMRATSALQHREHQAGPKGK
jgi:hypothetical protein